MCISINLMLQQKGTLGDKHTQREEKQIINNFYLKIESSMGKHQLSQVHLKLPKRTRQLPSRKHKALRNLIACDMIHTRLILLHNWLHKHLPLLLFKSNKTKSCKLFFFGSITRTPFGSSENKTRETHQKQKKSSKQNS